MAKNITTTQVNAATFKNVFAAYPELKYDLAFLTNDNRDLIIQFRVKAGFTFVAATQGRVLSAWLGEKVGEYRQVSFDSFDGGVIIIYKAMRNYKFQLTKEAALETA
ncbi:hypothetical protein ABID22_000109 [Pontibacter aydingkolensis]|uniref:Uncharacterized protein n=1 Tax=Pontibacter aydingkolensis TaxID=1911536 RepID=A0ABS7CQT8_9BACT|nr:hypothetical protein [Pontibacter aydingkolensis]MBW7466221.1 hypothetical protein [Pontibacter aydingkolensis]